MKNKILSLILMGFLCVLISMPVLADSEKSYCVDSTGRFTADETAAFNAKANEIIDKYDIAPYFVVVNDTGDKTEVQFTEDFYEENASGTNCLIMMLTDDTYYVLPIGTSVDVFEYKEEYLYDAFYGAIYNGGTYSEGALAYLDEVESEILDYKNKQAIPQTAVDNNSGKRMVDNAEILEPIPENTVSMKLDEISNEYQCDVIFVTIPSTYGMGVTAYADDYFDYNGYGMGTEDDGVLFLISMEEREWEFSVSGNAKTIFNDDVIAYMEENITSYLRKKDYEGAADRYAAIAEQMLEAYENGTVYDKDSLPKATYNPSVIVFGIVAGIIIVIVIVMVFKSQSKKCKKVAKKR